MDYKDIYNLMNDYVNSTEQRVIINLVQEAFQKAAKTFQDFIRKNVHIELISLNNILIELEKNQDNKKEKFVLISELKGDIKGKCYLYFETLDAKKMYEISQVTVIKTEENMFVDFLLELANILTASMVTLLSNKLQMNVYAYVPKLHVINDSDIAKSLIKDQSVEKLIFNFNTKFVVENTSITSNFIWVMEMQFLDTIIQRVEEGKIA